jgi:alpha-1,3/alpha-1,6-mannosyltransferase
LKRAYRLPFDFIEEWSMGFADSIAVNSGFTKNMATKVWPDLVRNRDIEIIYPCVDVNPKKGETEDDNVPAWRDRDILLSINRFEMKKDIGLAIKAYAKLGKHGRKGVRLVLAGEWSVL